MTYNQHGELATDVVTVAGGAAGTSNTYTYDDRGDIIIEDVDLGNGYVFRHRYEYDRGGRLTRWTQAQPVTGPIVDTYIYTYDKAGNRLTQTRTTTTTTVSTWTYDQRNRVLTGPGSTYTWNANGTLATQVTSGVTTTFAWDALGRQTSNTKSGVTNQYYYDSFDRLVHRYIGVNWQIFAYNGTSQPTIGSYDYANKTIVYSRSPSGKLRWLVDPTGNRRFTTMNRHGDLRSLTNQAGTAITETVAYTPFGEIDARWGGDPDPELGFQGQYTDPATGDVLMQSRWYSPGTATFRSRDSYAGDLNTPVSLNRYTYAHNNPVRYWDPSGFFACYTNSDLCNGQPVNGQGLIIPKGQPTTSHISDTWPGGKSQPPPATSASPSREQQITTAEVDAHTQAVRNLLRLNDAGNPSSQSSVGGWEPAPATFKVLTPSHVTLEAETRVAIDRYVTGPSGDPCYSRPNGCMLLDAFIAGSSDLTFSNCRNATAGLDTMSACGFSLVTVGGLVQGAGGATSWIVTKFGGASAGKVAASVLRSADNIGDLATNTGSRGLSNLGGIIEETGTNAAGGRIFTSTGAINQNDFRGIVQAGLMRGDDVHIFTGAHGLPNGSIVADAGLFADDVRAFGGFPGVRIHDLPSMTTAEVQAVLNGPGTIIGGICNSGACLRPGG